MQYYATFCGIMSRRWLKLSLSLAVFGDVNQTLTWDYKFGGRRHNWWVASPFWEIINVCGFLDLGFSGPIHTWTNNEDGASIMEHIDQAWCNFLET